MSEKSKSKITLADAYNVVTPDDSRPFRIPGDIGKVPLLPIFGIGVTLLMASQLDSRSVMLAAVLTAAGPVLFGVVRMSYGKQRTK